MENRPNRNSNANDNYFDPQPRRGDYPSRRHEASFSRPPNSLDMDWNQTRGKSFEYGDFEENARRAQRYEPYRSNQHEPYRTNYSSDYSRNEKSAGDYAEEAWTSVKNFFGIGPKGYKRSDEKIKEDCCEALYHEHSVDASEIEVSVKDSEVILTGTVPERHMKRRAEDCCERVAGVKDVRNEVRVQTMTTTHTSNLASSASKTPHYAAENSADYFARSDKKNKPTPM